MNKLKNQLTLAVANSLYLSKGEGGNLKLVQALVVEIAFLGFKFDKKLLKVVKTLKKQELVSLRKFLIKELKIKTGANIRHEPLFRKFPEDVPDEDTYFYKRIIGYLDNYLEISKENPKSKELSCGCFVNKELFDPQLFGACPICQRKTDLVLKRIKRKKIKQKTELKNIYLMTDSKYEEMLINIFSVNSIYSKNDKENIKTIFELHKKNTLKYMPKEIKIKENLVYISYLLMKNELEVPFNFKTATDVLRLAVALSGGDLSLKNSTKFNLKNKERKFLLEKLELIEKPLEDMLRYRQKWLRLGEYLHVANKKNKSYRKCLKAFDVLRNDHKRIETFNKKISKLSINKNKNLDDILAILEKRPGEFLRKIDGLLREVEDQNKILDLFEQKVKLLTTKSILKFYKFIETRDKKESFRFFIPKGNTSKIFVKQADDRKTLQKKTIKKIKKIIEKDLFRRFKTKGKDFSSVYIHEELKNILIPLSLNSAPKGIETLERGSKIKFSQKAKILRMFVYWKEKNNGRIDVDLSAAAYDKNWEFKNHLSWTSLQALGGKHSGDIQSAPNGASEFIDINLKAFKDNGIRYVVMNTISYTGQVFDSFESFAGIMERNNLTGEIFEPKTVANKFDLSGKSSNNIPMILDVEKKEIIWANLSLGVGKYGAIHSNFNQVSNIAKAVLEANKYTPSLYDLFSMHVKANKGSVSKEDNKDCTLRLTLKESKNIHDILSNWI